MSRTFTISTPTVDLNVEQRGTQSRAVFVHGMGDDLHTWDCLWQSFDDEFSAVRYDLRGFGNSHCREKVSFKHADDLLAVLDTLAIDRCDLIGVSMGGGIAINFALDHPDRVKNLVVISPQLVAWEWSDEWLQLWRPIEQAARAGKMDEAKRLWWQHPLFATARDSAASHELYQSILRYSGEQWTSNHHELMLPDVERLHLLATRTLLLTGGRDLDDFRLMADLIEASATNLQRIDDPMRGHLLHLEDPERCARNIGAFFSIDP
jgi:pimeloyl-ACP methyl ester carboxylesterase